MKKSFKKAVAILLAVMMIVCSFPLTALAADDTSRANINLQFGDVSNDKTPKSYVVKRAGGLLPSTFIKYSGLNSDKLEYSNGHITGYSKGDFFTVSVLVENVTQISAAEVAIKYSDSITPAFVKSAQPTGNNTLIGTAEYTDTGAAHSDFPKLEAVPSQSGNAIYNGTSSTVGETSYIDAENRVMHANFAVQTGEDYVETAQTSAGKYTYTNTAVLATFMFKIVSDDAITFEIEKSEDPTDTYYLATTENGGKVAEYKTYAPVSETEEPTLDFMGENEYNEPTTKSYTITFVDENGAQISSAKYDEGTAIVAPSLPAVSHDDSKHYTYAWDKEVPATATADGTYTIVKTGADHTWGEGVVTKEATTTETGIMTYTCTFTGCGATKTEEIPKKEDTHTHVWSDWVYNNDASYDSTTKVEKNGTETRTCTTCGEVETQEVEGTGSLRVSTLNADFGGEISAMFGVKKTSLDKFDSYTMEVYREDGKTDIIEDEKDIKPNASGATMFFYYGITPQSLGSVYRLRVCGVRNGKKYYGPEYEYNIMDKYILKQICNANSSTAWRTLLVELVYYGDEAQKFANWKTDSLASASLDNYYDEKTGTYASQYKSLHDTSVLTDLVSHKNNAYTVVENPKAVYKSLSLVFGSGVILQYTMKPEYTLNENTKVKVQVGASEFTYTYQDDPDVFSVNAAGCVVFQFKDLYSKYLRTPVRVTWYEGDTQISNTYQWSAETYASGRKTTSNEYAITQQLMKFGNAARVYFNVTD